MLEQIAWGFCKIAFDAAQDECLPALLRRAFRRLGSIWFGLAVLLEGRALAAICDDRRDRRRGVALTSDALAGAVTALRQRWPARLLTPKAHGASAVDLPVVEAWSLPDLPHWQKLGLGQVWAVRCPFCRDFHTHLPGEGTRQPACTGGTLPEAYKLAYAGHLPRMLHDAFRLSLRPWPKLLLDWPRHDSLPPLLRAA